MRHSINKVINRYAATVAPAIARASEKAITVEEAAAGVRQSMRGERKAASHRARGRQTARMRGTIRALTNPSKQVA